MRTKNNQELVDEIANNAVNFIGESEKELSINKPTPEKVTVYRVAYNAGGEFRGFDYHASRERAQAFADNAGDTKTRIDEIEVEVSLRGIVSALNEYAISWDPDGFDRWDGEDE